MLEKLEQYALEHNVPIMQKEGIEWFKQFIKSHQITSVIEIGSAIGYSTLSLKSIHDDLIIDTIERDDTMYMQAKENLKGQVGICLHHDDALMMDLTKLQLTTYDLLFIDGAKGQYQRFFERFEPLIKVNGWIVVDNIDFHGMTLNPDRIKNRNTRQLVRKINNFRQWLENHEHYTVHYYPIGDGLLVARKETV